MNSDMNPLIEALKNKAPKSKASADDLLAFVLANFNLVPKNGDDQENEETPEIGPKPPIVTTQESHSA